jgi:hypothetical protein
VVLRYSRENSEFSLDLLYHTAPANEQGPAGRRSPETAPGPVPVLYSCRSSRGRLAAANGGRGRQPLGWAQRARYALLVRTPSLWHYHAETTTKRAT